MNQQTETKRPAPFVNDGVLVIDKPADWTSHDVVAKVRKILRTRRVGHTGTLDPFATGALVVCVNRATRLVQFLTGDDKEYLATMRLGFATDTGDFTGSAVLPIADASHITAEQAQEAFKHFRGRIQQIPPMYSAKKIGGVRLHELARRGEEIERQPIEIEIKELELVEQAENARPDELSFRVACTSGTYIRTLAEDIGKHLGVGAHLTALRRTRAGGSRIEKSVTLERLNELAEAGRVGEVMSSMSEVIFLNEIQLEEMECNAVANGRSIQRAGNWSEGEQAKLCDKQGQLLAIAGFDSIGRAWRPRVVFN